MKYILPLLFVVVINCTAKNSSYFDYYKKVTIAEDYILNSKFDSAAYIYEKIMSSYEMIFFKELNNAFLSFILNKDHQNALSVAKRMVLQGVDMNYFAKDQYDKFKATNQWVEFEFAYPALREEYLTSLNKNLRDDIYTILKQDQHYTTNINDVKSTDSVYYENIKKFLSLESKYGFPNFFRNIDTLKKVQVVFIHYMKLEQKVKENDLIKCDKIYAQMNFDSIGIHGRLSEWHRKGFIDYDFLERIHSFNKFEGMGQLNGTLLFDFEKEIVRVNIDDDAIEEYNVKRKAVGLPPISKNYKKRIETIWTTFNFKTLKEAYKNCNHVNDNDCFNLLFAEFRHSYLRNIFADIRFEGFIFSYVLMPNVLVRDDLSYRQFLEESHGFNNK